MLIEALKLVASMMKGTNIDDAMKDGALLLIKLSNLVASMMQQKSIDDKMDDTEAGYNEDWSNHQQDLISSNCLKWQ